MYVYQCPVHSKFSEVISQCATARVSLLGKGFLVAKAKRTEDIVAWRQTRLPSYSGFSFWPLPGIRQGECLTKSLSVIPHVFHLTGSHQSTHLTCQHMCDSEVYVKKNTFVMVALIVGKSDDVYYTSVFMAGHLENMLCF